MTDYDLGLMAVLQAVRIQETMTISFSRLPFVYALIPRSAGLDTVICIHG
jgi:hypothetical protein